MTRGEKTRLLLVANDKLEEAASALQRFAVQLHERFDAMPNREDLVRQVAGIELDVRHAMAAVGDIQKARRENEPPMSGQPCGCDPAAKHECAEHQGQCPYLSCTRQRCVLRAGHIGPCSSIAEGR